MGDEEEPELNGHGRPTGETGANAAPDGNDYATGNSGGGAPAGPANGNWKHGLYSQYMSPEDRKIIKELDGKNAPEKLELLIDHHVARYLRAAKEADAPSIEDIMATIDGQHVKVGEELDMKDEPLAHRADLLAKMIKKYEEITDGKKYTIQGAVDHTHAIELSDDERQLLDDLF